MASKNTDHAIMSPWREVAIRVACGLASAVFGMVCVDAALHDEAARASTVQRVVWIGGAVVCFVVALALPVLFFTKGGHVQWISPSEGDSRQWLTCITIGIVGLVLFICMQMGYVEPGSAWLPFYVLCFPSVAIVWQILAATMPGDRTN